MNLLYDLAHQIERNVDILPVFRARKRDIDVLVAQLHVEQDAILDALIQLQRQNEFHSNHASIEKAMLDQYYQIMAIAEEFCNNTTLTTTKTSDHDCLHIQLPKIQLPKFDGDILRWITFRDTYISLVHDNVTLTNIEKFHYLVSSVRGSASAVVRSIALSDSNYILAWNALNERFDNPRLIMNSHMDRLFNFSPLRSSSLEYLKHFLDTFQENIAAF